MRYEWDEKKCENNLLTHGTDFAIASDFDWDEALTIQDTRLNYSEDRFLSYAPIAERLYAMVWTPREDVCRIISLRKANRREVLKYEHET
jgi:uncharacterized DUF497 family protein